MIVFAIQDGCEGGIEREGSGVSGGETPSSLSGREIVVESPTEMENVGGNTDLGDMVAIVFLGPFVSLVPLYSENRPKKWSCDPSWAYQIHF